MTNTIGGVRIDGKLSGGWIAFIVVAVVIFIAIFIWGIVAASKTKDIGVQAGRLLLHLFLWGGFVAAIVYAIKASSNRDANFMQQQTPFPQQDEPSTDELLKRIEELEKKNKK